MKQKTFVISIISILAIFALIFSFTSCNGKKSKGTSAKDATATLSAPFSAKATIKLKDITVSGDISKTAKGCATMTVLSPPTLKGMQFQYDGTDIKASYLGMSVKLNSNSKVAGVILKLIVSAIDKSSQNEGISVKQVGDALLISGDSDGTKFTLKFDKKNGSIVQISMPTLEAECNFEDFLGQK